MPAVLVRLVARRCACALRGLFVRAPCMAAAPCDNKDKQAIRMQGWHLATPQSDVLCVECDRSATERAAQQGCASGGIRSYQSELNTRSTIDWLVIAR